VPLHVLARLGEEWRGGQPYQGTGYLQPTHHPLAVCPMAFFSPYHSEAEKMVDQNRSAVVTGYRIGSSDSTDATAEQCGSA